MNKQGKGGGFFTLIIFLIIIIVIWAIIAPTSFTSAKTKFLNIFKGPTTYTCYTCDGSTLTKTNIVCDTANKEYSSIAARDEACKKITVVIDNVTTPVVRDHMNQTLTVANWNLQIFGDTKSLNATLLRKYADTIDDYDIIFIQEIRDEDQVAFQRLCIFLPDYYCEISSRAGRTNVKEQYGIIYKRGIFLINMTDYNPDTLDRWQRPPIRAKFSLNGYILTVYNIHTDPEEVKEELQNLESLINSDNDPTTPMMVIGDLNADCQYYSELYSDEFNTWTWVVKDYDRTNMGQMSCAYDRIIVNDYLRQDTITYGVRSADIDKSMSDHYLIWAQIDAST